MKPRIWEVLLGEVRGSPLHLGVYNVIAPDAIAAGRRAIDNYDGPLNDGMGHVFQVEPLKIEYKGNAI